jgi:hypothetical protein
MDTGNNDGNVKEVLKDRKIAGGKAQNTYGDGGN